MLAKSYAHETMATARATKKTEIGNWVRAVRGQLKQDDFGERVKVDRVTVSNWERGRHPPDTASIRKIVAAFPDSPPPPLGGMSGGSLMVSSPAAAAGGRYTVIKAETEILARRLDAIEDDATRLRVMLEALATIEKALSPRRAARD